MPWKKFNISNSTQHMHECYSAWWDVQFLNLIQISVYYPTTSLCEHSAFGWRLFSVQTLFLQHFLLSFLPAITPITGSHSLQGRVPLPSFSSTILILSSGLLSDFRQKAGPVPPLYTIYRNMKHKWVRICQFHHLNKDKTKAFCTILLSAKPQINYTRRPSQPGIKRRVTPQILLLQISNWFWWLHHRLKMPPCLECSDMKNNRKGSTTKVSAHFFSYHF